MDNSGRWSGMVPLAVDASAWNRTIRGRRVRESGWCLNDIDVSQCLVRSRDPQLRVANFTGATTLYIFRDNDTLVTVKPEASEMGTACYILPPRNDTFQETEENIAVRNGTEITGPDARLALNVTGAPLSPLEIMERYGDNPFLIFFCGFSGVRLATAADDATFPATNETSPDRVLQMVTMDTEVNILVSETPVEDRFLGNEEPIGILRSVLL